MSRNNADARRCSYFELGLPVIIFAVLAEYERVQNLVRVMSRAERGPGFSPQSLARLAQDSNECHL